MRVLALEPYYGGSHQAFLDGWSARSRHTWTVLSLPPYKWKWRMRHAAITLAEQVMERVAGAQGWDLLFCSDMLNLAEFVGLAPEAVRRLPRVVYFHENQLTYPVRRELERDWHYAFTNLTTALAGDEVWFNSAYHRDAFLKTMEAFLKRMPDHQPLGAVDRVQARSRVHWPGIDAISARGPRPDGPLRILAAARWEHDKGPATFFAALALLEQRGMEFRVSVIGERFREVPPVFIEAEQRFAGRIDRWGYQPSREAYESALTEADVIVSTAEHEFFGISVVEAVAAGAWPLLPERLAYPEVLGLNETPEAQRYFYDGTVEALASRLAELAIQVQDRQAWTAQRGVAARAVERFDWSRLVPSMDQSLADLATAAETRAGDGR